MGQKVLPLQKSRRQLKNKIIPLTIITMEPGSGIYEIEITHIRQNNNNKIGKYSVTHTP